MKYYITQAGRGFVNEVLTKAQIDQIQKDAKLTPKQIADAKKKAQEELDDVRKGHGLEPHKG